MSLGLCDNSPPLSFIHCNVFPTPNSQHTQVFLNILNHLPLGLPFLLGQSIPLLNTTLCSRFSVLHSNHITQPSQAQQIYESHHILSIKPFIDQWIYMHHLSPSSTGPYIFLIILLSKILSEFSSLYNKVHISTPMKYFIYYLILIIQIGPKISPQALLENIQSFFFFPLKK